MTSTGSLTAFLMPSIYDRPRPGRSVRCMTSIRPGMLARQRVGDVAGAVGRLIVDHHHAHVGMRHQPGDEHRQVRALVERRHDDQRARRRHGRPSKRSEEICSDTSPTSRITTLDRMSSTDELVTCDCVTIVQIAYTGAGDERGRAHGQKDAQRAEDRDHLQQNQEKADAVGREPDLRRALTPRGLDRLEADAVARLHERQRGRRRRREPVGQQMQELDEALAARRAESRGEIGNRLLGEIAGDGVQRRVAEAAGDAGLRRARSRADDEIVRVELRDQAHGVGRGDAGRRRR